VVSALDGVMPQTQEHVVLARQVGVSHVVALSKADARSHAAIAGSVTSVIGNSVKCHWQ
jgi:translation elongation factor EF-Tu-like GTPase